jgi:hypothetical protein
MSKERWEALLTCPRHTVAFYNGIYACSYGADDIDSEGEGEMLG